MFKRITSFLLAMVMMVSMLPLTVWAEETVGEETVPETSEVTMTEETQTEAVEETIAPAEETVVTEPAEETTAPVTEPAEETDATDATEETVPEETVGEVTEPAAAAVVETGECGDNATWTLDSEGTLTISGTGPMRNFDGESIWESSDVRNVVIKPGITRIGAYGFYTCEKLVSITIPDSVQEIGDWCFYNCDSLKKITIPSGVYTIGYCAFSSCESLERIEIDSDNAYYTNDEYGVLYNKGKTSLIQAPGALQGKYVIPNSVRKLENSAFSSCKGLESVTIPGSIAAVTGFGYCDKLESVTILEGTTTINAYAFYSCPALKNVELPESLRIIGANAFAYCIGMENIVIPYGVTSFEGSTFASCLSLTEIVIPDTVSFIGTRTFVSCSDLVTVTIGSGVETIRGELFAFCTSLETVYFRGNVPVCEDRYGEPSTDGYSTIFDGNAVTVYYPECDTTWTKTARNQFGSNITWVPYEPEEYLPDTPDHVIEQLEIKKNSHVIVVADAAGDSKELWPIAGALVNIDGLYYETDEDGVVICPGGSYADVTVIADGYQSRKQTCYLKKEGSHIFFMEKVEAEGFPYIMKATGYANGRYFDLRDSAMHFTEGSLEDVRIYVEGNWGGMEKGKFRIYQEPTAERSGISARSWWEGQYIDIAPGQYFHPDAPIKISMNMVEVIYDEEGVPVDTIESPVDIIELKFVIDPRSGSDGAEPGGSHTPLKEGVSRFDWIGNHPVKSDNEIFTKLLTSDMSIKTDLIPVEIEVEHHFDGTVTYKGIIGLAAGEETEKMLKGKVDEVETDYQNPWDKSFDLWKKQIADFKEAGNPKAYLKNLKKEYSKLWHASELESARKFKGDVVGFIEIRENANGETVSSTGGVIVNFEGSHTIGQTFFGGPIPLYYEFKPGIEITVEGGIELKDEGGNWCFGPEFRGIKMALPSITLEGGAGVRGVGTVGLGADGKLETEIKDLETVTGTLKISGFLHMKVLFIVDFTWDFIGQEIPLFPKSGTKTAAAYARMTDENGNLSLASRDYLDGRSSWNGAGSSAWGRSADAATLSTLQTGVMPDAMPKLHQVGDRLILLMLQDDPVRAIGNHTRLVYSVLEDGVWSEPEMVMPSDTADYFFDSRVENGQLYVTWQKAAKPMEQTDAAALLEEVTANSEICVARWDDAAGAFADQRYITSDQTLDMMPRIAGTGSGISVLWVSNDINNVLGSGGTYSVRRATVSGGTVTNPVTMLNTSEYIVELCANTAVGGAEFMYIAMAKDNSTKLYLVRNGSKTEVETTAIPAGLEFDGNRFLWNENGTIRTYASGRFGELVREDGSASYRCITNGEKTAMVWLDSNENGGRFEASFYEDSTWCEPITLLENIPGTVNYYDAKLLEDGAVALILNNAEYGPSGTESTALLYALVPPRADIALQAVTAEQPNWETGTQKIRLCAENLGDRKIENANLTVTAGEEILLDTTVALNILPGEEKVLEQTVNISGMTEFAEAEVTLTAFEDEDPENDCQTVGLGQVDVSLAYDVYHREEQVLFVFSASNASPIPANVTLHICENSLNGTQIGTIDMGQVTNDETVQHTYSIDLADISAGGMKHYFFRLSMDETDWNEFDNYDSYTVSRMREIEPDPSGEMVQIELVDPTAVQIQPGELTFSDTAAESVQLQAYVSPENASVKHVEWSVENADIVHITSGGMVTPLRPGSTTVTATVTEGISTSICVTVLKEAHEHTEIIRPAIPPICTENGLTEGRECSTCGEVLVAQNIIPATGHSFVKQEHGVICSQCCSRIALDLPQEYIALLEGRNAQLDIQILPGDLLSKIQWSVDKKNVIEVDNGVVTAVGEGTAYVTATVSSGDIVLTDRCRVDVTKEPEVTGIQLSTQKLTSELYSTDYAQFEILLQMPQNEPKKADPLAVSVEAAMSLAGAEDLSPAVESAAFMDETMQELFELRILDDRRICIVPSQEKAIEKERETSGSIRGSYISKLEVWVQGKRFESEPMTLTVKKTLPKLKATAEAFNSFYSSQIRDIVITGGTPVRIYEDAFRNTAKTTAIPDWLELTDGMLTLKRALTANASGKAYLLVDTEEWRIPAAVTLSVKNTYKRPDLKLSATTVTMFADPETSDGIRLILQPKNKKDTLDSLGVNTVTAAQGFAVENFDRSDGSFTLKATESVRPDTYDVFVSFKDTENPLVLPVRVKTKALSLKLSASSVTLNAAANDSKEITVTADPLDYDLKDLVVLGYPAEELTAEVNGNVIRVGVTEKTEGGMSYTLTVRAGGAEKILTVKTTAKNLTVTAKVKGNMDLSFPEQAAGITPVFKNYSGKFAYVSMTAADSRKNPVTGFTAEQEGDTILVTCAPETAPGSYTLTLNLKLDDGKNYPATAKVTVKRTAVKLKLSASKVTMNKDLRDVATVNVSCTTKGYAFDLYKTAMTFDEEALNVERKDGNLIVTLKDAAVYGKTYTVAVSAAYQGAPAVKLSVAVAKQDIAVKSTIKAAGTLDVIRDSTAITVTPTYSNVMNVDVDKKAVLKVYSSADKYQAVFAEVEAENGVFILDDSVITDHTLKYKAQLETAVYADREPVKSNMISLNVKMGSTKLTVRSADTTLFAQDKNDRVTVWFEAADGTLNDVADITIKDAKQAAMFDIIDYGNGVYAIGFKDKKVHESLLAAGKATSKTVTVTLNVFIEGNLEIGTSSKVNTTAKVKLTIVK